jgi:hypothetical protein
MLMLFDKQSNTKHNNMHCSTITTWCCNARLEMILGLEKRREDVGGWNKDDVAIK